MAARLTKKRLPRYSLDFKLGAVKLTNVPGVEVQVVAEALDVHPVMLSRWRQEAREGRLKGFQPRTKVVRVPVVVRVPPKREIKKLKPWRKRTGCCRRSTPS